MSRTSVKPDNYSSSEYEDFREENSILSSLHDNIDELRRNAAAQRLDAQKEQDLAQSVDNHEQWIHASSSARKLASVGKTEQLLKELYATPYIGRFDLTSMESDDAVTHAVYIGKHYHSWGDKTIIGWADDSDPEKNKIITAFRRDTIEPFSARGNEYIVALKRKMIVENGELNYVVTIFDERAGLAKIEPASGDTVYISDPFLLEILRRNRNKGALTDIIATIQQQQDEIIRRPANENMIVQGCAGSGKTQILFHRLGYFKQGNKTVDWNKVHVISPSRSLRKQTAALAKSLDIGNIPQLSLEEYYLDVLVSYNKGFHNGSFVILSEDDLPLKYLAELYSKEFTHKAKTEILAFAMEAIDQVVKNPFVAVKLKKRRKDFRRAESYHKIQILKELIQSILTEDAAADYDKVTREYQAAQEEYSALLAALPEAEESLKQIEGNIRDVLHFDAKRLDNYKEEFEQISFALDECEADFEERKANAEKKLKEGIEKKISLEKEKHDLLQAGVVDQIVLDKIYKEMPSISALKQAVETYSFNGLLQQQFEQKRERLKRARVNKIIEFQREFHTRDLSPEDFEKRASEETQRLLAERKRLLKTIERTESFPARLQKFEREISELQVQSLSSDDRVCLRALNKSLNDLPKNIYNKVVLRLTIPLKEKHSVGGQLQSHNSKKRILYRRDLYYLLYGYYTAMGPTNNEKGHIFFFDEGQNISRTDYYLIFKLTPHASFNILGDTEQCLYSQLGIASWGSLHKENFPIYTLRKNYRNTTQVVDFINQKLKMDMIPLGLNDGCVHEIGISRLAFVLSTMLPSKTALIVAGEAEFECLVQNSKRSIPKLYFVSGQFSDIPKDHIPVCPVAAVRGLEFNNVLVYEKNMSKSMQYVAYSRSLQNLYLIH